MFEIITLILGLTGLIVTGGIVLVVVLESTRERSK